MDSESLQLPDADAFVHTDSGPDDLDRIDEDVPVGGHLSTGFSQSSIDSPPTVATPVQERCRSVSSPSRLAPNFSSPQKIHNFSGDSENINLKRQRSPQDLSPSDQPSKKQQKVAFSPFQPNQRPKLFLNENPEITNTLLSNQQSIRDQLPPEDPAAKYISGTSHVCPHPNCGRKFPKLGNLDSHLTTHIRSGYKVPELWLDRFNRDFCPHCHFVVVCSSDNRIQCHQTHVHSACRKEYFKTFPTNGPGPSRTWKPKSTQTPTPKPNHPQSIKSSVVQSTLSLPKLKAPAPVPDIDSPVIQPQISFNPMSPNIDPVAPSLHLIFTSNIPTRTYIPANCIPLFSQCLKFAIDRVLVNNDVLSWSQLFSLPKCTLFSLPSKSSSKDASTSISNIIKSNLQEFLNGNWVKLFCDTLQLISDQPRSFTSRSRDWVNMVNSKVQAGNVSSAFRSLESSGVAPNTPDTIQQLSHLHPSDPNLCSPKYVPTTSTPDLSFPLPLLEKAIKSFPLGSSPGPDGFRPQHLVDLLRLIPQNSTHDIRPSVAKLVVMIINGKAHADVAQYFASARLIPLLKKDNGIRPIAVGSTWRRLCGKIVNLLISDQISPLFTPIQFGVGVQFGSEVIVHSIRHALKLNSTNKDFVLLQADFSNAFNCVSRPAFLTAVATHLPHILPFVSYCYATKPLLFVSQSSTVIESLNGTQQGDPLGPLLFCLAINLLISKFSQDFPDLVNLWYMDDGHIGGPTEVIAKIINVISQTGPTIGVFLNLEKSKLFWPHPSQHNSHLFPPSLPRTSDGLVVLGTPIGSEQFISNHFSSKIEKNDRIIKKLPKLNDPQISFALLSKCMGLSKVGYFLRTSPCSDTIDLATRFDNSTNEALELIIGKDLPKIARLQTELPLKLGGLGLRSAVKHAPASFLSSINSVTPTICSIFHSASILENINVEKESASQSLSTHIGGKPISTLFVSKSQRVISESIDDQVMSSLLNNSSSSSQARIHSCSGSHGAALLNAPLASVRGFKLSQQEFTHFISTRLGLQNISNEGDRCTHCRAVMDTSGYHVSICKFGDFSVVHRHNSIRNVIHSQCQRAAWSPKLEHVISPHHSQLRPADIFIPIGPSSQPLAIDVTIVNPLSPNIVERCAKSKDFANLFAEKRKINKYTDMCSKANITFKALSIESFGRMSPSTSAFVSKIATAISNRFGGKSSSVYKDIDVTLFTYKIILVLNLRVLITW